MLGYVLKRAVWAVVLLLIISFFTFILFFIVAGEVRFGRGQGTGTISLSEQYALTDRPLPQAYTSFLWRVVRHGDLGTSFRSHTAVSHRLLNALPVTASLVIGGAILWILIAFAVGIMSALKPRSLLDRGSMVFVLIGISAHPVWLGFLLAYFFGFKLGAFPIGGYCPLYGGEAFGCQGTVQWAYHLVLPWLTFAALFAALYARMIRATILEAFNEEYVRTARAKGAGEGRILGRHVLRNSLLPIVTMVGMDVGLAFGGVVFVEKAFGLPGIGTILYDALARRDQPLIMGVVLIVCTAVVVATTMVDIVYRWIDPRIGLSQHAPSAVRLPRLNLRAQLKPKLSRSPSA